VVTDYISKTGCRCSGTGRPTDSRVTGLLAVFLTQNAYHAGPIAASQSTLVLIDPLASILIGIGLFGDNLRTGRGVGPLEAISLLVLFSGAVTLCQSPMVSGVKVKRGGPRAALAARRARADWPINIHRVMGQLRTAECLSGVDVEGCAAVGGPAS